MSTASAPLTAEEQKFYDDQMAVKEAQLMGQLRPIKTKDGTDHWDKQPRVDLTRANVPMANQAEKEVLATPAIAQPTTPSTQNAEVLSAMDKLARTLGLK